MSFLSPLYLAATALIALPVMLHLLRRVPRGRIPFSAVAFLQSTPPRTTRRSRIDHWLLLVLRCLAVLLIALAFARPFLREYRSAAAGSSAEAVLVLVDTSASMRRESLWEQAVDRVGEVLAACGPGDFVSVRTFDTHVEDVVDFEQWSQLPAASRVQWVQQRLRSRSPGWRGTDLAAALVEGAATLARWQPGSGMPTPRAKRLVVLSDLQRGSSLEGLETASWPASVSVKLVRLSPREPTNAGISLVGNPASSVASSQPEPVRVRVTNAADSESEHFTLRLAPAGEPSQKLVTLSVEVPAGRSRVVRLLPPKGALPPWTVILEGDAHPFDNVAYVPPRAIETWSVVHIGDDGTDPTSLGHFLVRAFPLTAEREVRVIAAPPDAPGLLADPGEVRLVVVSQPPTTSTLGALRRYVENGGTLLCVLTTPETASVLSGLFDHESADLAADEANLAEFALLAHVDYSHPLFAPFAEARYADFTAIRFWRHRNIRPQQLPAHRVLARFDDGWPALIEIAQGRGRVFILTSGWHPDDSQLALSTKFAPLLNGMASLSGGHEGIRQRVVVGEPVPVARLMRSTRSAPTTDDRSADQVRPERQLRAENASTETTSHRRAPIRIERPDGEIVTVSATETDYREADQPGLMRFHGPGRTIAVAVEIDPRESRTSPLSPDTLSAAGVAVEHADSSVTPRRGSPLLDETMRAEALEASQSYWRWLVLVALAVLMVECGLARRFTHQTGEH